MAFPIPTVGVFDTPTVTAAINKQWVTFVIGALEKLLSPRDFGQSERTGIYVTNPYPVWAGDDEAQYLADQEVQKLINLLMTGSPLMTIPSGTINPILTDSIPAGWLACDGSEYDEVDYPDLYAALPAVFKSGGTFVVPNLTGRSIVGSGSGYTLGGVGGSDSHVLALSEIPAHSHGVSAHNHSIPAHGHTANPHTHTQESHDHTVNVRENAATLAASATIAISNQTGTFTTRTTSSSSPAINSETVTINNAAVTVTGSASPSTASQGGGGSHNNMPPYFVANYIIKV